MSTTKTRSPLAADTTDQRVVNRLIEGIERGLLSVPTAPPKPAATRDTRDQGLSPRTLAMTAIMLFMGLMLAVMSGNTANVVSAPSAPTTGIVKNDLQNSPAHIGKDTGGTRVTMGVDQPAIADHQTSPQAKSTGGAVHLPVVPAHTYGPFLPAGHSVVTPQATAPTAPLSPAITPVKPVVQPQPVGTKPIPNAGGQTDPVQIGSPAPAGNGNPAPAPAGDKATQPAPKPAPVPAPKPEPAPQPDPSPAAHNPPTPTQPTTPVVTPPVQQTPPPVITPPAPKPPVVIHHPAPKPAPKPAANTPPTKAAPVDTSPATAAYDNSDGAGHGTTSAGGATPNDPGTGTNTIPPTVTF